MNRPAGASPRGYGRFVFLAALLLAAHAWILRGFIVDDAFISFRYARNIAAGLGPVFNPGERVEGYSNPVYTFLLAAIAAVSRHPDLLPIAGRVLGLLAACASLVVIAGLPGVAWRPGPVLAAVLCATTTSFALWSIGGLETPLHGFLVVAAFAATLRRPKSAAGQAGTGLLLSLVTLSRPEGALVALVLFLWRFADPDTRRDRAGHLAVGTAAVLPVALYVAFRLLYFGDWLPNTYYAKNGPVGHAFARGLWYLVSFVHDNGGKWLYVAAPLAFLPKDGRRAAILAVVVLLAQVFFILMVGGDWMDRHRFIAPFLPLVWFLVAQGWAAFAGFLLKPLERWPGGAFPGLVRFVALGLVWLALFLPERKLTIEQRSGGYVNASPYYDTVGKVVGVAAETSWQVATHDIGAIGWYGKARVLDLLGLVDPDLAHGRIAADSMVAGMSPEIVILHYDNRKPSAGRWRPVETADFEARYAIPMSPVVLPGSFRVRRDVLPQVQARLLLLSPDVRRDLVRLNEFLATRQPDGHPWTPPSP